MRIFLYESICAGGFGDDPPDSLRREGWAMLSAVAADFAAVADVSILLTSSCPEVAGVRCERTDARHELDRFRDLVADNDATLVIAPETGGALETRSRMVLEAGRRLLGSPPDAIRLTADKLALAEHWRRHGIATPITWKPEALARESHAEASDVPASLVHASGFRTSARRPLANASGFHVSFPAVIKLRDGAGSVGMRRIESIEQWKQTFEAARQERQDGEWIVQPLIFGRPRSVAFLVGSTTIAMPAGEQRLSDDGRFAYLGGRFPLAEADAMRAHRIAEAAIASVPGLQGYVGVDVILADNGLDQAIEINPRLTTSYVGLRRLCRDNLADAWLRIVDGKTGVALNWHAGPVEFDVAG